MDDPEFSNDDVQFERVIRSLVDGQSIMDAKVEEITSRIEAHVYKAELHTRYAEKWIAMGEYHDLPSDFYVDASERGIARAREAELRIVGDRT